MRYSIFRTRWGWFGLCGTERGLVCTCLPLSTKSAAEESLFKGVDAPAADPSFLKSIQKFIKSYYEGSCVDFSKVPVCLNGFTEFQREVLTALRRVKYGQKISYSDLAKMVDSPRAVRALGQVMARNPLPLIIPCHRVIRSDGSMGGFSGGGGIKMKERMLDLESVNGNKIKT